MTVLFHEFGHGLHHMLTQVNERDVSGISGVEWDAVELPSQFMENFCWERDVLKHMTVHVETGDGVLQGFSRPRAEHRCLDAASGHGLKPEDGSPPPDQVEGRLREDDGS
jgi:hypothetical protein